MKTELSPKWKRRGEVVAKALVLSLWTLLCSFPLVFVLMVWRYRMLRRIISYPIQFGFVAIGIWAGFRVYKYLANTRKADQDQEYRSLSSELTLFIPAVLASITVWAFLALLISHRMAAAFDWDWHSAPEYEDGY